MEASEVSQSVDEVVKQFRGMVYGMKTIHGICTQCCQCGTDTARLHIHHYKPRKNAKEFVKEFYVDCSCVTGYVTKWYANAQDAVDDWNENAPKYDPLRYAENERKRMSKKRVMENRKSHKNK